MTDINIPIIIGAAAIDSINPCAFGVLIFLLSYLASSLKSKNKILSHGLIYIFGVFITYLIAGSILLPVIRSIAKASVTAYFIIAILIVLAGLLEIKDFFWYGKWFSLSIFPSEAKRITHYVKNISASPLTAFFLGVFVALVELPCTGAAYLAVLTIMSLSGLTVSNLTLLILYNLIFVFPLILILFAFTRGISAKQFQLWGKKYKKWMRLAIGIVLLLLGFWMIFIVL